MHVTSKLNDILRAVDKGAAAWDDEKQVIGSTSQDRYDFGYVNSTRNVSSMMKGRQHEAKHLFLILLYSSETDPVRRSL